MSVIVKGGGGGKPEEEKTVTAGTSAIVVSPSSGKVMKKVTVNPTPSQEKTVDSTGITQIILPDEGKLLSKVTIEVFDPTIVTWAGGTDEEIVKMVQLADAGTINLADYWAVGDERQVTLSAMEAIGVGESHVEQTVTFVLMNAGGKTLANATASGRTECNFIVGMKNGLAEKGYMNSSKTNSGGWEACARRTWCNSVFRNAIPEALRDIFKQHLNITADGSSTTTVTSTDYFALPAEKEVFGYLNYANTTAEANLTQFEYYTTKSNRIKQAGDGGSVTRWWERSPRSTKSDAFCRVHTDGSADYTYASLAFLLAPFGVI